MAHCSNVKPKIDFTFAGISRSFPVDPANLNLGPTTPSNFCTGSPRFRFSNFHSD